MSNPVVIGIDPGSHSAGIAVVKGDKVIYFTSVKSLNGAKWDDTDLGDLMVEFMMEVQQVIEYYDPELMVVELTSVPKNMHTNKLLSYWEACAIIAAGMNKVDIKRMRTKVARKIVFDNGNIKKEQAINLIRGDYNINFDNDEAEAIVFALAGAKSLNGRLGV